MDREARRRSRRRLSRRWAASASTILPCSRGVQIKARGQRRVTITRLNVGRPCEVDAPPAGAPVDGAARAFALTGTKEG